MRIVNLILNKNKHGRPAHQRRCVIEGCQSEQTEGQFIPLIYQNLFNRCVYVFDAYKEYHHNYTPGQQDEEDELIPLLRTRRSLVRSWVINPNLPINGKFDIPAFFVEVYWDVAVDSLIIHFSHLPDNKEDLVDVIHTLSILRQNLKHERHHLIDHDFVLAHSHLDNTYWPAFKEEYSKS